MSFSASVASFLRIGFALASLFSAASAATRGSSASSLEANSSFLVQTPMEGCPGPAAAARPTIRVATSPHLATPMASA